MLTILKYRFGDIQTNKIDDIKIMEYKRFARLKVSSIRN